MTPRTNISFIVPTWNEENWLPRLLSALSQCLRSGDEVIIADNDSDDHTRQIARESGDRVTGGGLPAAGRNRGATVAKEQILCFLDADVTIDEYIVLRGLETLSDPWVVAVHMSATPVTSRRSVQAYYRIADWFVRLTHRLARPQGLGTCLMVRSSTFTAVGGYDERVAVGEESDLLLRLSRLGKVEYLTGCSVPVSGRRWEVESATLLALKTLMWSTLRVMGSRRSIVNYSWRRYPPHLVEFEAKMLARRWTRLEE